MTIPESLRIRSIKKRSIMHSQQYKYIMRPNFEPRSNKPPLRFEVEGDPIPFFKSRHTNRKSWDSIQTAIRKYKINLENQHENHPVLEGPLFLYAEFYLPYRYKSDSHLIDRPHADTPKLTRLVEFIEVSVHEANLIEDCAQISSQYVKKSYHDKPRTEFILYEIVA